MFSFALRRGAFISHKLFRSVTTSQTCWTSSFSPLSQHGSTSRFSSNRRSAGRLSPAPRLLASPVHSRPVHSSAAPQKRPQPEPPPRELDLLRYDMRDLSKSPKPALYLGVSGLLPFVCPTLFMAMTENFIPEIAYAQVALTEPRYCPFWAGFAGVLRFPSSPAKPDWINLANSVVPSLLAWVAMLMSENVVPAATMVIMGLGVALHYDLSLLPTYPSWFKALRSVLTVVASLSLFGMLIVYGVFPEKKLFSEEK